MSWAAVVPAFTIALGIGFSLVGLLHEAGSRAGVDVQLAQLDGAAAVQDTQLWRAVAERKTDASLDEATNAMQAAARRMLTGVDDESGLAAAVAAHRRAAESVRATVTEGQVPPRAPAGLLLTPSARRLHTSGRRLARRAAERTRLGRRARGFRRADQLIGPFV